MAIVSRARYIYLYESLKEFLLKIKDLIKEEDDFDFDSVYVEFKFLYVKKELKGSNL